MASASLRRVTGEESSHNFLSERERTIIYVTLGVFVLVYRNCEINYHGAYKNRRRLSWDWSTLSVILKVLDFDIPSVCHYSLLTLNLPCENRTCEH